jgi:hypothetical protein
MALLNVYEQRECIQILGLGVRMGRVVEKDARLETAILDNLRAKVLGSASD